MFSSRMYFVVCIWGNHFMIVPPCVSSFVQCCFCFWFCSVVFVVTKLEKEKHLYRKTCYSYCNFSFWIWTNSVQSFLWFFPIVVRLSKCCSGWILFMPLTKLLRSVYRFYWLVFNLYPNAIELLEVPWWILSITEFWSIHTCYKNIARLIMLS